MFKKIEKDVNKFSNRSQLVKNFEVHGTCGDRGATCSLLSETNVN